MRRKEDYNMVGNRASDWIQDQLMILQQQSQMGNLNPEPELVVTVTPESLKESIQILKAELPPTDLKNPSLPLFKAVATINQSFLQHGIYAVKEDNLTYIHPAFISLFIDPNFQTITQNWFKHWEKLLQQVIKTSTLLIKLKSWRFLSQLTKLLIAFSSDRICYILNNITVLPLCPESKQAMSGYNPSSFDDDQKGTFITKLNRTEAESIYKYLLVVMNTLSAIKTSHISRSEHILAEVDNFFQHSFMIFNRIYFSETNYNELRKRAIKINNETNIEQIAYFLGYSAETNNPALFDISVIFAISLISGGKTNPSITSLPSHLFKHLPTCSSNNIYEFMLQIVLLSMTQKKSDSSPRLLCNRFNALRLCYYLLLYSFASLNDITIDYIQNICVSTKLQQIQRIFVVFLIQQALQMKEISHLKKFQTRLNKPFQLLLANTQVKYSCEELIEHFRKHEEYLLEDMQTYYYDYLQQSILKTERRQVQSKVFWERVLNSKRENRVTC